MMTKVTRAIAGAIVALLVTQGFGQIEPEFETRVTLNLKDDHGAPVEGADTLLSFLHKWRKNDLSVRGKTDINGRFEGSGKIVDSLRFSVQKEGFYSLSKKRALIRMDVDEREVEKIAFPLVIREKVSPIGLNAKRVSTAFPEFGEWVGFDLERSRWIDGKDRNQRCDVLLRFTRKMVGFERSKHSKTKLIERLKKAHSPGDRGEGRFPHLIKFYEKDRSYSDDELIQHSLGKWNGRLEIKFPGKEEGIVVVDRDYVPYCELKMPHLAYEKGYVPSQVWTKENWGMEKGQSERGYFLRTRVKLDESGKIISANYAKIIEEIKIDPRGRIEFAYVFNPTANDRNLEFDPKKNLFGKLEWDEEVRTP